MSEESKAVDISGGVDLSGDDLDQRLSEYLTQSKLKLEEDRRMAMMGHPDAVRREIFDAHDHCSNHKNEILASKTCGCFYCKSIMQPHEITSWTDSGKTAFCPKCDLDTVIGSNSGFPITTEFLEEMKNYWFPGQ